MQLACDYNCVFSRLRVTVVSPKENVLRVLIKPLQEENLTSFN